MIMMPLGTYVALGPEDCVRWGSSDPPSPKGAQHPHFSAHVDCVQTAGWMRILLGTDYTDVGLALCNIVLLYGELGTQLIRLLLLTFAQGCTFKKYC